MKTFTQLRKHLKGDNSQQNYQSTKLSKPQNNPTNQLQAMSQEIYSLQARCKSKSKLINNTAQEKLTQSQSGNIKRWNSNTFDIIEEHQQPSTAETIKNRLTNNIDVKCGIAKKKDVLSPNKRLQFTSPNKNKIVNSRTSILSPDSSMRRKKSPHNKKNDPITVQRFIQNPQKVNEGLDQTKRKIPNQRRNILAKNEKDKLIIRLKGIVELVSRSEIYTQDINQIYNKVTELENAIKKNQSEENI